MFADLISIGFDLCAMCNIGLFCVCCVRERMSGSMRTDLLMFAVTIEFATFFFVSRVSPSVGLWGHVACVTRMYMLKWELIFDADCFLCLSRIFGMEWLN